MHARAARAVNKTSNFERHIARLPSGPLALAYSGGGDSTALLHMLRGRAHNCTVMIIDHALREGSAAEAEKAKSFAESLGYDTHILRWSHGGVTSAMQERARNARYTLLGLLCRSLGIPFLVTAHTAGDQAETCLMRYDRGTGWRGAAGMSERVIAPLWPELDAITVLRPLLGVTRTELRAYNRAYDLPFVDDPSNENRSFARIRARDYLELRPELAADLIETADAMQVGLAAERRRFANFMTDHAAGTEMGYVKLSRLPPKALLTQLMLAVGGQVSQARPALSSAFIREASRPEFKAATWGGAKLSRGQDGFLLTREAASVKGRYGQDGLLARLPLFPGAPRLLWDGRFWASSTLPNVSIGPLYGQMKSVPKRFESFVKSIPADARPALPIIWQGDDIVAIGHSGEDIDLKSAIPGRLQGQLVGAG